ncbi:efflux RND transporter periplasmic adaptor subunit [Xenophilus aerolatus]|nr:efflux RND transporter periplasmic adaptor subunit [Xenophilus aerolatus]
MTRASFDRRASGRLIAAALAGWTACVCAQPTPQKVAPPAAAPVPAGVAPAAAASTPVRFLVMADRESTLAASTSGRFSRVAVSLGDTVRAGQLLAAFDCGEVQARRDAARAELEAARVQYEGKVKLQGLQSAAEIEVELAASNVNKAQSQIRVVDAQLAQCNFVAPFAGRIARVHVKVGQGVNPGAPVIDIVGSGPLKARMNVPSNWLAWLKPGEKLAGRIDETGDAVTLKVARLSARVDAVSQTVEIEADVEGSGTAVLPGMSGQARAPSGR